MAIDFNDPLYKSLSGSLDAQLKGGTFGANTGAPAFGGSFDEEVRARLKAARAGAVPSATPSPIATATPTPPASSLLSRLGTAARVLSGPAVGGALLAGKSMDAGAGSGVITDATTGEPLPARGVPLTPALVERTGIPTTGAQLTPKQIQSIGFQLDEAEGAKMKGLQAQTDARTARVNEVIGASQAARGAEAVSDAATAREASPVFPRGPSSYGDAFRFLAELGRYKAAVKDQNEAIAERRIGEDARSKLLIERAKAAPKQIPIETLTGKGAIVGDTYVRPDPKDPSKLLTSKVPAPTEDKLRPGMDPTLVKAEALAAAKQDPSKRAGINAALKANGYAPI